MMLSPIDDRLSAGSSPDPTTSSTSVPPALQIPSSRAPTGKRREQDVPPAAAHADSAPASAPAEADVGQVHDGETRREAAAGGGSAPLVSLSALDSSAANQTELPQAPEPAPDAVRTPASTSPVPPVPVLPPSPSNTTRARSTATGWWRIGFVAAVVVSVAILVAAGASYELWYGPYDHRQRLDYELSVLISGMIMGFTYFIFVPLAGIISALLLRRRWVLLMAPVCVSVGGFLGGLLMGVPVADMMITGAGGSIIGFLFVLAFATLLVDAPAFLVLSLWKYGRQYLR